MKRDDDSFLKRGGSPTIGKKSATDRYGLGDAFSATRVPGRASGTAHLPAADGALDERSVQNTIDLAGRQLATLEAIVATGDEVTIAGHVWIVSGTLASLRAQLAEHSARVTSSERAQAETFLDLGHARVTQIRVKDSAPADIASQVTQSGGEALPFAERIQASFGRHDVTGIRAHVGGVARDVNHQLGAQAFAFGSHVAFATSPNLHTAAHEAAHVVQQRAAVALKGGIDQPGDAFEQHADQVADAVVSGQSAEALLDRMASAGSTAAPAATTQRPVQRKTGDAPAPKASGPTAPDLKGASYQWVPGTFNLWVSSDWFKSASDFSASGEGWIAPSRIKELLGVLRQKGMLAWASEARIAKASNDLVLNASQEKVRLVRLGTSAFDALGLPPGTQALVGKRSDRGLDVVISVPDVDGAEGKDFPLSLPHKQQIVSALESFTKLKLIAEQRQTLLDADLKGRLGANTSWFVVNEGYAFDLFGKGAYAKWFDAKAENSSAYQFDVGTGSETIGDLTPEEVSFLKDWLKQNLNSKGGRPVVMGRLLYETLKQIDDLDPKAKQRVIAMLHGTDQPEDGQLTSNVLERIIQKAKFDLEREAAGFKPHVGGKKERPPVFDVPIPARIDQRNGLLLSGESVQFKLEIDWPTAYTSDQQSEYTWRPMVATIDWLFERELPTGGKRQDRERSFANWKHDGAASHTFKLEPGEDQAVWSVHAFVQHNFFQPNHLVTQVEVKTEAKRLGEMRKQSFAQLGSATIAENDHDFETSTFNEALGDHAYDHGRLLRGDLPADFERRTPEERKASLEAELKQNEQLLEYLRKEGKHPEAVAACEHYIARLRDAEQAMDGDLKDGWQPFEIRGFYLGRGTHIADGSLDLYGAVRRTKTNFAGASVDLVQVQIRDLSRRFEAENYRFEGTAGKFEPALELAFVDLCKKYPKGRLSILAEGFTDDSSKATGKSVGFELETATEWKDVKAKVFDPVVNVAVNIAAAITMIVFPATIPIVLPLTIAYNETQNIDQLVDELDSGTFTKKKGAIHLAQFALDVLPLVGRAPVIRGSRAVFGMFEVANFAGQAILMKEQVQETIKEIRDTQIKDMAELYAKYVELEKTTQASDPNLATMRAELDKRGEEIREAAIKAWTDAAAQFAIIAVPAHVAQAIDVHITKTRVVDMQHSQQVVIAENVEPHYDPRRGQIVGDEKKLDRPTLDKLTKERDAHLRDVATRAAEELGVDPQKIEIKPDTGTEPNKVWKDGEKIELRYKPGTDPEEALAAWKASAKKQKIGKPTTGKKPPPAHEPPAGEKPRTSADHELISETAKIDKQLAEGHISQAKETTAAAVAGSSFKGGVRSANAEGVLVTARTSVESAAKRFKGVKSVEQASSKHVTDPSEKAKIDDTFLITMEDGKPFTVRITSGPIGSDALARSIVNPTKEGATYVNVAGADPVKHEVKGRYVVQLSDTIEPANAERAIAHEVGEILAERELSVAQDPVGPDLLKPDLVPASDAALSPHDRGRIGEIKVLAAKVNAGDAAATRELIALVEELGLREGSVGATERRRLVFEQLAGDSLSRAAVERVSRAEVKLEPDLKTQLSSVRDARNVDLAAAEAKKASQKLIHDLPDAKPEPGQLISPEHARELALQAAKKRSAKSHATIAGLRAQAKTLGPGEYPKVKDVQVGGGAALAARDPNALFVDARGRWQADASDHIAQTANQLRGLKDAGIGDPFQFAKPDDRVPMSAVRYWEDSIAAQGPVVDGQVTGIAIDDRGRTIMTIAPGDGGTPIKVQVEGDMVMSTGFPIERIPGTPRGMSPDKGVAAIKEVLRAMIADTHESAGQKVKAQATLHQIENLSGLELAPGQREKDLATVKKALHDHGLESVIETKAKDAFDMVKAGDQWQSLRKQHPDKFVLGDMANLESLDAMVTDKWLIGGPGGTGISAAEIVLAKNSRAHVTMVGNTPPPGLIENDQFLKVIRAHGDAQTVALYERLHGIRVPPGDGRFSLVLGIDVQPPSIDAGGQVHAKGKGLSADYVPPGYDAANNPLTGGAYISSIGREPQLPPLAEALKQSVMSQGGQMTMQLIWDSERQYAGYRLTALDRASVELRQIEVTGAASRFPPWELMDPRTVREERARFIAASDFDAPAESGGFDGGFSASAAQAARYAKHKQSRSGSVQ